MSSPDTPERDSVDELLTVKGPTSVDRIRSRLLAETTSVIRRRRFVRRLGVVAALTGCYLAGIATTRPWNSFPVQPGGSVVEQGVIPKDGLEERVRPTPRHPESPRPRDEPPARRPSRRDAALARADFDKIRRVSDRYLYEKGDIAVALHYYSRALNQATPEERAISVEKDSWLLMALKQSRIEEDQEDDRDT